MPASASWLIPTPPAVSPFSPPAPLPPLVGSPIECDFDFYDQDYLLRVVDRAYPLDYIYSLKVNPNGGYEIFQAATKMMERVSVAISRLYCCAFLMSAGGGNKAIGSVEFLRSAATAGAITIKAGTIVTASASGRRFLTTTDAVFSGAALGPIGANVIAEADGYEYNLQGQVITASNATLPGEINTIEKMVTSTPQIDELMEVRQVGITFGGESACLDGIGNDLEVMRQTGETDEAYRVRILETPDTVSPDAIRRGLTKVTEAYNATACFREVGTTSLPGFFFDAGSSADAVQVPANNYAYDMDFALRPADRFKLWLSFLEMRAFFLVGVPAPTQQSDFGLAYDGTTGDAFPLKNAYDTIAPDAKNAAYDGFTVLSTALYQAIWEMIEAKRAGGVSFDLYVETVGCP